MRRIHSFAIHALCAAALITLAIAAEPTQRPNIILCMTDDQGWGDVSYNGLKHIQTPNLDAMAAAGLRFNRFYSAHPSCSPTRASVMTGRHPFRDGTFWPGMPLRKQEMTLAQAVKRAGYATGHFGKWHLSGGQPGMGRALPASDPLHPGNFGFDEWFTVSNWFDTDWTFSRHGPPVKGSGDGSDAVYNNDFFGGDLAGIIEKLDYIKSVGANTIYMTPVFKAASNHKYDTADYKNIDPHVGGNDDFIKLTKEAASRGIRVIPDTSLNHVGSDSIYFDRYAKHGTKGAFLNARVAADSPYADWFRFDTTATEPDKQYKGWVGVLDLPEINKSSPSFRKFAYGDKDSVTKLWLDRGAAGWRMDVVPWVPDDFWRAWRAAVKSHKPDAITIAETWFDSSKFFLGDTFDSTMNYIFRNTVLDYANGGTANVLYQNIEWIREAYPPQAFYALMNLVSSHDQARALHLFGYKEGATPEDISRAKQRLKLATFFQMTFPGAPAIYYGDEVGVTGGDDPYNRATYPWADLGGKPDTALLAEFQAMTKMRRDHAVLRHGTISAPIYSDANVIVLARRLENSFALVATNNAVTAKSVHVTLPDGVRDITLTEALTAAAIRVEGNTFTLNVPPVFGVVLVGRVGG